MNGGMRKERAEAPWWISLSHTVWRLLVLALVGYVVYRVAFIIVVVLVAVMLALTLAPAVDALRRSPALRWLPHGARRATAATVVFVALVGALVMTGSFIVQPLASELREFTSNWSAYQQALLLKAEYLQQWYAGLPTDVRVWVERQEFSDLSARFGEQLQHLIQRTVESGMLLVELILIPVLAFSFLTEGRPLKREYVALIPYARLRDGLYVAQQTGRILQSYAIGQLILALIAGAVVYCLMLLMGIKYALALAVIAAVTRVIPVVGPIIGGIPIVLLSSLQGWDRGLGVLIAFSLMHLIESKVVMPRIIGYRIKLHPAVVIIVLLIGAEFFGMWGMFLAAPVAAVIKSLIHYFLVRPHTRARVRRTPGPPPEPPARRTIARVLAHSMPRRIAPTAQPTALPPTS